jgi:hypothetical protein
VFGVAFWGYRAGGLAIGAPIARMARTRAKLNDGVCIFAADVALRSRWGSFAFSRNYLAIKSAMVTLLRSKSAYMVSSESSREALRQQMLQEVNRVGGGKIADRVTFSEFFVF